MLSPLDISLLNDIQQRDPSFDLTSALMKIREDMIRRKELLSSRTKELYDLLRGFFWRIQREPSRIVISALISGTQIEYFQKKILSITEGMFKSNNLPKNNPIGIDIYPLGYIQLEEHEIDILLSDLKYISSLDCNTQRKGFVSY